MASVLGDILTALTRTEWLVGTAVAVVIIGMAFVLNMWQHWWMSSRTHEFLMTNMRERLDEARSDADQAVERVHADATEKVTSMRAAMERRIQELREDGNARAAQVRADSQAELDRLLKIIDAIQREVESWRQAFHLADQANREEDDARWTHVVSALTVLERLATEVQRQVLAHQPRELDAGRDRGAADVR